MRCKKQILYPFRRLLCLVSNDIYVKYKNILSLKIGWRPFGADSLKRSPTLMHLFNIIYPLFILILLLFNYVYEIIVCQGKLNVVTDTKVKLTCFFASPPVRVVFVNRQQQQQQQLVLPHYYQAKIILFSIGVHSYLQSLFIELIPLI